MNEQIKELMKEAGTDSSGKWMGVEHAKKFAQLIVRECISALEEKIHRSIDHEGDEIWADLILKEHFGVEE